MSYLNRRIVFWGFVSLVVASLFALSLSDYASTSRTTQMSTASPAAPRITILYDAFGKNASMKKDWGFSALIEMNGKRLDFVVMSHRHGDHMGGLT
jgi:7,8-dihydropterin-6-yl-methyl-4-(beta-D-ribofuranosyl)aminobenzene 5'-phosphate synthase